MTVACRTPRRAASPSRGLTLRYQSPPVSLSSPTSGVKAGLGRLQRLVPELTAFFTSAPILASSAEVNSVKAKAVGHMESSSRFAESLNPSVAYLVLNLCALWKKQTTLPSLAYAGIPYQSFGERAGALALMTAWSRSAMARSASGISAIFASTALSSSALFPCAARGGLQLLGAFLHRASLLLRESPELRVGRRSALGGLLHVLHSRLPPLRVWMAMTLMLGIRLRGGFSETARSFPGSTGHDTQVLVNDLAPLQRHGLRERAAANSRAAIRRIPVAMAGSGWRSDNWTSRNGRPWASMFGATERRSSSGLHARCGPTLRTSAGQGRSAHGD